MAIKTKRMSDWLSQNGEAITNASKASMIKCLNQDLRPLQDGVYIGQIYNENLLCQNWQTSTFGISSDDADAIVIQFGGYRLGIALTEPSTVMSWGSSQSAVGYDTTGDLNTFDGKTRTAGVMASATFKNDDPATYAVAYCYNYRTENNWWLPTMGELSLIHQHFETINLALQRIKDAGKQSVDLLHTGGYWSCCEAANSAAWILNFSDGNRYNGNKINTKRYVRPVTAF